MVLPARFEAGSSLVLAARGLRLTAYSLPLTRVRPQHSNHAAVPTAARGTVAEDEATSREAPRTRPPAVLRTLCSGDKACQPSERLRAARPGTNRHARLLGPECPLPSPLGPSSHSGSSSGDTKTNRTLNWREPRFGRSQPHLALPCPALPFPAREAGRLRGRSR